MVEIESILKFFDLIKVLDSVSLLVITKLLVMMVLTVLGKITTVRICIGVLNLGLGNVKIDKYPVVG